MLSHNCWGLNQNFARVVNCHWKQIYESICEGEDDCPYEMKRSAISHNKMLTIAQGAASHTEVLKGGGIRCGYQGARTATIQLFI